MNKCTICGKPIVLVPSAQERARRYGGTPQFYTSLFTTHSDCAITKRAADTAELMRRPCRVYLELDPKEVARRTDALVDMMRRQEEARHAAKSRGRH